MAKPPLKRQHTRRSFIALSATPMAALLLQRCAPSRTVYQQYLPSPFMPTQSDHPLTSLRFKNRGIAAQSLNLERLDTPVLYSEGIDAWHAKGIQSYSYSLPFNREDPLFEQLAITGPALYAPPLGIRSALSLGGLGTGTLELRSDGRLANWQIFNNSPGDGVPKVHLDEAFFGIRTSGRTQGTNAITIRTHPPDSLPAIDRIAASGSFPATYLHLHDPSLPIAVALYAYGSFDLHELHKSCMPAVVFSFVLFNPGKEALNTSLMFNLPNVIDGTFRTERGLILSRSGSSSMSGSIYASFSPGSPAFSMVTPELPDIWEAFESSGSFERQPALGIFKHGGLSTQFILEPGASRTVSLVLAWHFPNRFIANQPVGNAYAHQFSTSTEAGQSVLESLPAYWNTMQSWHRLCFDNSLPSPIQDALNNSLSLLYKTTFCTADGRWRHWDSFANPSISSLPLYLYRIYPLLFFYPDLVKNQLRAYAATQNPTGPFSENLGMGERYLLDTPHGVPCSTKTPVFFLLAHAYYAYSGDYDLIRELWPYIRKAVAWQLSITTPEGIPSNFARLGDWQSLESEGVDLCDTLLHLSGLTAVLQLSRILNLYPSMQHLELVIQAGRSSLEQFFWKEDQYVSQYPEPPANAEPANQGRPEAMLGFLWPLLSDLSIPFDHSHVVDHLKSTQQRNIPAIALESDRRTRRRSRPGAPVLYPASSILWTALDILLNEREPRFDVLLNMLEHQSHTLNDMWAFYEQIKSTDGAPWANPHHASHFAIWFVIIALNGQRYNAASRKLMLNPRLPARSTIPFFTPMAHGLITADRGGNFIVEIISGRLALSELQVGPHLRQRDVLLEAGQSLRLSS